MSTPEDLMADYLDPETPDPVLDTETAELADRLRGALGRAEMWDGPSDQARSRLLNQAAVDHPVVSAAPASRRTLARTGGLLAAVASGAVAAALVLLLAIPALRGTPGTNFDLTGGPHSPAAVAVATIQGRGNGGSITLAVEGLPAAEPGTYYSAWVMGDPGMVPIGSFHNRNQTDNDIELWSGVDVAEYSMLMVTVQAEGEPPFPMGPVALRGPIDPG